MTPRPSPMSDITLAAIGAHHIAILRALDEHGGMLTRDVAKRSAWGRGSCRAWLGHFRQLGLAAPVNGQTPVAWVRTKAGSALLRSDPSP